MTELLAAIGYDRWILHVLLAVPLVGMAIVIVSPTVWARHVALVVSLVEAVLALGLWWAYQPARRLGQRLRAHAFSR